MFVEALLVAVIVAACYYLNYWFGYIYTDKPIIVGTLVGFALGDLQTGIICGATFELIFLGAVNIGGAVPSDPLAGTAVSTAFVILTGMSTEEAMALAIPTGLLMAQVQMLSYIFPSFFNGYVDSLIERDKDKGFGLMVVAILFIRSFIEGIFPFLAIFLGTNAITAIMDYLPEVVTGGFSVAGGMLAAVGFAMLLKMIWTKELAVYFFIGFFMATYLNIPTLGIAIAGLLYCIVKYYTMKEQPSYVQISGMGSSLEEEDLFND